MKLIIFWSLAAIAIATTLVLTNKKLKIMSSSKQDSDRFPKPPVLVTRLVHHHSVHSPFYNPNHTLSDRSKFDLIGSISRVSALIRNPMSKVQYSTRFVGFLAYVSVGEKRLEQLLLMDTGSSLLWLNCVPCSLNVPDPIFDPKSSSTYKAEDCDLSEYCGVIGFKISCDRLHRCSYYIRYGGNGYSAGHLASETLVFGSTKIPWFGKREEVIEDIVLGCSKNTNIHTNGILGLGSGRVSLLKQRSFSKFSYCLGYYAEAAYSYNRLIIGEQAKQLKYRTPLLIDGKYFINLVSIRIGHTLLDINYLIFKRDPETHSGGLIVDSAASFSFLPQVAYVKFEAEIINIVGPLFRSYNTAYGEHTRLCYWGDMTEDLAKFPSVQFIFENNARLIVDRRSIFQQISEEEFCLTILPSEQVFKTNDIVCVLGIMMQQGYYISYDLEQMMLAFEQMPCHLIEEYINDEL
ncbi:hypothetical protein F511_17076 [Dorcoceras hygrometricum]|uniref:Peptidase A1 domain-containing protein n=1 Tax=Dorcoceras hygrometricum TaxID=472368 RepID=A0A2Z7CNY7_9LAMI|nr:hypothetical protein F511_38659 [Dorcoceras hygrometricum]KZV48780.1 hypothetical protein F511_17076 [Dorcoceras hygrometricum]